MTARASVSLKTKLAAALLQMKRADEQGRLMPIISHEDAKLMSADQIISLFQFDHWPIFKVDGGPDEPWNLEPKPILEHRKKTAERDVPQIAKTRRIVKDQAQHRERVEQRQCGESYKPKGTIPSRPNAWGPKGVRKLRSRGFERRVP